MLGVYFSGTGNTRHCVEVFAAQYKSDSDVISIEDSQVLSHIAKHDTLAIGYPVYFSNAPRIMQDFIAENGTYFRGKQVFVIATMGLWSGDGAGCAARLLKRHGARIIGGLHLRMPDCICDERVLKKPGNATYSLIQQAETKIAAAVRRLKNSEPTREGLSFPHRIAGLLGQRLWFYGKTKTYNQRPLVDTLRCNGCGLCARLCPMKNLTIKDAKAEPSKRCTLCYRCANHCPTRALTILGRTVHAQYSFADYE